MAKTTTPAYRLSWQQALSWRMRRHHLVERATPSDLVGVTADICGLHAQLTSSAELSLWARIDDLQRDAVQDALWRQRTLVKLWATRGTLYVLPAAELSLWLAALGTYSKFGNTGHPQIDVLADAVGRALQGRVLTREELALAVERITGSPTFAQYVRSSWGSYLKAASFRGLICFAPSEGGRVRFTSPASCIPGALDRPDPNEALREIARRFLGAYGPATAHDLTGWWVGGGIRCGERMLAALGEEAVEVDVDGECAWALARDVHEMASAELPNTARLLPAFDPWIGGAVRRAQALLDQRHEGRIYRPQGWVSPALLVNGQMVGVWRHARRGRRLLVEIEPFGTLPSWAAVQVEAEAERLAASLGGTLELSYLSL